MTQTIQPSDAYEESLQAATRSYFTGLSLLEFMNIQRDALADVMQAEENRNDAARWAELVTALADADESIRAMEDRNKFLDKRLDHAVKRLKSKDLYADNVDGLARICLKHGLADAASMLQITRCCMGEEIIGIGDAGELDDNSWRLGVDLAMAFHEKALSGSDQMYGLALEPNFKYICVYTVMAAHAAKMNYAMHTDVYKDAILDKALGKFMRNDAVIDALAKTVSDLYEQRESELTGKADQAETEKARALAQLQELKNCLAAYEKGERPDRARADRLQAKNTDLENDLAAATARIQALQTALDHKNQTISGLAQEIQIQSLPELPEKNVVFLGGHPNMTKKLKLDHPGWLFIPGSEHTFPEFKAPDILFLWDKHMGHPAWKRAMDIVPPGTDVAYVKSTNLDNLELEMRRAWAAVHGGHDTGMAPEE